MRNLMLWMFWFDVSICRIGIDHWGSRDKNAASKAAFESMFCLSRRIWESARPRTSWKWRPNTISGRSKEFDPLNSSRSPFDISASNSLDALFLFGKKWQACETNKQDSALYQNKRLLSRTHVPDKSVPTVLGHIFIEGSVSIKNSCCKKWVPWNNT